MDSGLVGWLLNLDMQTAVMYGLAILIISGLFSIFVAVMKVVQSIREWRVQENYLKHKYRGDKK